METPDSDDDGDGWRGVPLNVVYRGLPCHELRHFDEVRPSEGHTVLYQWPPLDATVPPVPHRAPARWDPHHVRLPCSVRNQYPVEQADGTTVLADRWELVQTALLRPIRDSHELETAILSYNTKYAATWKFRALHKLFDEQLDETERDGFFRQTLPKVVQLALQLPELVPGAIPLLKQGTNGAISMSQQQAACLLANSFLCTFPRRNTQKMRSEYSTYPHINFYRLFASQGQCVVEKIKCLCNYFRRVCHTMPTGVLTFERIHLAASELPDWDGCGAVLCRETVPLHVTSRGTIEDEGRGLLQVDFANKFIGGGVLGHGCVQEEIRFVINPELMVSKLFTEALWPNEALLMMGTERFCEYAGYASSFTFAGDHVDRTPRDASGRRECYIVGIDALRLVHRSHQYREELMVRELNKAYVGFRCQPVGPAAPGIATGNWGCGAFGGDAYLKALLQLMVACVVGRPLVYFTFGDRALRDALAAMYRFLGEHRVTVRQLWHTLKGFRRSELPPDRLYDYVRQKVSGKREATHETRQTEDETLATLMQELVDDDDGVAVPPTDVDLRRRKR